MARYDADDMARRQAEREALEKQRLDNAVDRYGETLGNAFYNYAFGKPESVDEQDDQRRNFATNVILVLESGSRHERIEALSALLRTVEAKIEPVAYAAHDASLGSMPIGSKT